MRVLLAFALCLVGPLAAQKSLPSGVLDFDLRREALSAGGAKRARTQVAARLAEQRSAAGAPLRYRLDAAGRVKTLTAAGGALTAPSDEQPERIVRDWLRAQAPLLSPAPFDVTTLDLEAVRRSGPLTTVELRQTLQGKPVWDGSVRAALDAEGRLQQLTMGSLVARVQPSQATLSSADAGREAFRSLGLPALDQLEEIAPASGRRRYRNPYGPGRDPLRVNELIYPATPAAGRLAYHVLLDAPGGYFSILIDAENGRTLYRQNLVRDMGQGRIWTQSPLAGEREVVEFAEGWVAAGGSSTVGNNIDAFLDEDSDNEPDDVSGDGLEGGRAMSESLNFDFPADGFEAPFDFQAAAVTNAFYFGNVAHDFFFELGFRELDGNFQQDNFGLGGDGGDPVRILVQNGVSFNNASMLTLEDGEPGRMRLGVFLGEDDFRDSALDGDVVIHEYTHGVSNRLVGGRNRVGCLSGIQPGALGEAWSDYYPASFFDDPVAGEYVSANPASGIRRAAYDANPRDYSDIGDPVFEVHNDGEIFGAALWDIRQAIGREAADQLILDALRLTPCDATFVDARDALLQLAQVTGAEHRTALWNVLAARGLGLSASALDFTAGARTVFNAAFDPPQDLAPGGNRSPQILSNPEEPAVFPGTEEYLVEAEDPDGDSLTFELLDGPPGARIDPQTGLLTWDATFAGERFSIAIEDDRGGRAIHGYEQLSIAFLEASQAISIGGGPLSTGLAEISVPPDTPALQVRLAGGEGDPDLILFDPMRRFAGFSLGSDSAETLTIADPEPGNWTVRVDAFAPYSEVSLTADLVVPRLLEFGAAVEDLAGALKSETLYRIEVAEGTPLLRVVSFGGEGDLDLWLTRGTIPTCQGDTSLRCTTEFFSEGFSNFELITVEDPEPGDWFLTVFGFEGFDGAELRVEASAAGPLVEAAADAAAFRPRLAPLGLGTLFGSGFSEQTAQAESVPLPVELGGVRVFVDGLEAPLLFVSPEQINFQTPSETFFSLPINGDPGAVNVVALNEAGVSNGFEAELAGNAPGIFMLPSDSGTGPQPAVTHADFELVTVANPAQAGESLIVFLTGVGLLEDAPLTGEAAAADPLAISLIPALVEIGGSAAPAAFAGLTPGFVGLAQVNFAVPADLGAGDQSLTVAFQEAVSQPVSIPIIP